MFPVFFDTRVLFNLIRHGVAPAQVEHRIGQMRSCFPDAIVAGYEDLTGAMTNDPKDRHVLAAAVRGGAELLVSENTRDFPESSLKPYELQVVNQDDFLLDQLDLAPHAVLDSLRRQASRYRREPRTAADLLQVLGARGSNCPRFASACRELL